MESAVLKSKKFSAIEKVVYVILGALLTGTMWRARGTHGWGGEFGVFTVGLLLIVFIYSVFKRKTNASYFQIIAASTACMLTTPAWGTLLNQTSGYFEVGLKDSIEYTGAMTAECTPLSGLFFMLCLGFGTMPLFMFILSRNFSDKKYSWVNYIIVFAVFFATYYIACATVAHPIVKLVQPESVEAFKKGIIDFGKGDNVYSVYMKHFADINWGKKVPFGRNYFTEISVVSRAVASAVTAIVLRFIFKDKAGGKITFWGCTAFAIGISVANVFFVLENKFGSEKYSVLDCSWSFWEFFTGFISGLIIMIALFSVDRKCKDEGFKDNLLSFIPTKVKDIILCLFVFVFGFGVTVIRPFASRLDESDVLPIVVWVAGGIAILAFSVLMIIGKLPKMWNIEPTGSSTKLTLVLFAVHMFIYMFVGYKEECLPAVLEHTAIQCLMYAVVPLFFIGYILIKRKELFASK